MDILSQRIKWVFFSYSAPSLKLTPTNISSKRLKEDMGNVHKNVLINSDGISDDDYAITYKNIKS